jgi:uncharacterized membrane protein YheB (UPF0754 family)
LFLTANEIAIPFVTGFVGYFTNYLAIKMLFRPHKKRIYSLGWQGVIPKNRGKLAKEVGILVGNNLLTEKEILKSFKKEEFQAYLQEFIRKELRNILSKDYGDFEQLINKVGLNLGELIELVYDRILLNEEFIDSLIKIIVENIKQFKLGDFIDVGEVLTDIIKKVFENEKWKQKLIKEISAYLNNIILSGVCLRQIIPASFYESLINSSGNITLKILEYIKKLSEDEEVKKNIVKKLVDIKNNSFKSGLFDQLKLGMLNLFLNEDVIADIVNSKFPEIIENITESEEIKEKISITIKNKVADFLGMPVYKLVEKLKVEDFYSIKTFFEGKLLSFMNSPFIVDKISYIIDSNASELNNIKVGDIYDLISPGSSENVYKKILLKKLKNEDIKSTIVRISCKNIGNLKISGIYDKISQKTFRNIVDFVTREANELLHRNITPVLETLNIQSIVEEKINSLNLYEVENMLFSFMKDQFKWINILGFVLGFIFGCVQIIFFKFI